MDFVVETDGLVAGYSGSMVLRELSLRVPRTSIYGFLGPNGAGKTTALRVLLGLLQPNSGEVRLFGKRLADAVPRVFRRIGSLIEQPSLYEHLTGAENMEIARRLKGSARSDAERAIEGMGASKFIGKRVREYSRGMRQRLGVAIAIMGEPELLLLDEPMTGMDASGLRMFRTLLQSVYLEKGTTVLLSSHQFEEVEQVATHIGIMSATGDLLFQGTRAELSGRVPQQLAIGVDRWEDAAAVLASRGYSIDTSREHLIVRQATREMAREVNELLVSHGIGVHHLEIDSATLAALFLKITTTLKPWSVN